MLSKLKQLTTHVTQAVKVGVDMVGDKVQEKGEKTKRVVVAGNDGTGKTTLLYMARYGADFNQKLVVPTVGYNMEVFTFGQPPQRMEVLDLGGGRRMGPLFYKHVVDTDALIFLVRVDDPRFASALWELYMLLRVACAHGDPVHVRVLVRGAGTNGHAVTHEQERIMLRLCERDALPPTRATWSDLMELYNFHTLEWDADLQFIESKGRTASHGMPAPLRSTHLEPVTSFHKGSWTVMRLPTVTAVTAMQPFTSVHDSFQQDAGTGAVRGVCSALEKGAR